MDQVCQLIIVSLGESYSSSGHNWTSGILEIVLLANVVEDVQHSWLSVSPRTGILGFLLSPDDFSCCAVTLEFFNYLLEWEGTKTFDAKDGYILSSVLGSLSLEIVVNLTRAENHLLNLSGIEIALV